MRLTSLAKRRNAARLTSALIETMEPRLLMTSVLAGWDFSTQTNFGTQGLQPTTIVANVSTTGLTRGPGVLTTGTAAGFAWGGNGFLAGNATTPTTESAAITAGDYFSFNFTPASGYLESITTLESFNVRRSASGPQYGELQYSTDGTNFNDVGSNINYGNVTTSLGNTIPAIDLSGIAVLQNASSTVTLRLVSWGGTSTSGTLYLNDPTHTTATDFAVDGTSTLAPSGNETVTLDSANPTTIIAPVSPANETFKVDRLGTSPANDTTGCITVPYTISGSAVGVTYTGATTGNITIGNNALSGNITLALTGGSQANSQTLTVTLGTPSITGADSSNIHAVADGITTQTLTTTTNDAVFALSNTTYSVNANTTAGNAVVSVIRSGDVISPGSVAYSISGAVAATGTVNFAANQTVGTITFAVSNSTPAGIANITLSAPTDTGGAITSLKANFSHGTDTIVVPVGPANTTLITGIANKSVDAETSGVYGESQSFAPVSGGSTGNSTGLSFAAFEVLDFNTTSTPSIYPPSGDTVNSVANFTLALFNTAVSGTYGGQPGNFNIYFVNDADSTGTTVTTGVTPGSTFIYDTTGSDVPVDGQGNATYLGTYSFDNNPIGYDYFSIANVSAISSTLVSELNSGTEIRFIVAPSTPTFGADWAGPNSTGNQPTLSYNANLTQNISIDSFSLGNSTTSANSTSGTYMVSETAGNITIPIDRAYSPSATGSAYSDAANITYTITNGTALAGTNYTGNSTPVTVSFAANQTVANVTIPITNVNNQGGNKEFMITLSSPTATANATNAVLGDPYIGDVIITDSINTANNTESISAGADASQVVATTGPTAGTYGTNYIDVLGSSNNQVIKTAPTYFSSYTTLDFNNPAYQDANGTAIAFVPSAPVTAINSLTLNLTSDTYAPSFNGVLDVYLESTVTPNPYVANSTTPAYQDPAGNMAVGNATIDPSQGTTYLLGTILYNTTLPGGAPTAFTLSNYSQATENQLVTYLNAEYDNYQAYLSSGAYGTENSAFRIVIAPGDTTVGGSFYGAGYANATLTPSATFNVTEAATSTSATLPPYITVSSGAAYTYTSGNFTLTSGTATFTADSTTDTTDAELAVTASGSSSHIVFNSSQHITGLTLTGGATAVVNSIGSARSHSNHYVLVVGTLANTTTVFSIDSAHGSKLDMMDNDLIVHNGNLASVQAYAATGRNVPPGGLLDGTWDGNGLTSSTASNIDVNVNGYETNILGVASNGELPLGSYSSWQVGSFNETLGSNDIIVKYTYNGDFALEGQVSDDAATIFGTFYDGGATTTNDFAYGDMNGDGTVDDTDSTAFGTIYGLGTGGGNGPQL